VPRLASHCSEWRPRSLERRAMAAGRAKTWSQLRPRPAAGLDGRSVCAVTARRRSYCCCLVFCGRAASHRGGDSHDSPPFCDQHHCTLNRLALGSVHVFPTTCSSSNHFNIPKSISRHLEIQRRTTGRTRPTPCETSAAGHWFPVAHTDDHTHPESSRNTHSPVIVEHRICVCLRTKGPAT
jgi:hypothetical protein